MHTPGPYTIEGDCIRGADGIICCKVIHAHGQIPGEPHPTRSGAYLPDEEAAARYDEENHKGNKALLAAAPALLAACMALVNRLYVVLGSAEGSRCYEEIKAAEAAIARATGEE